MKKTKSAPRPKDKRDRTTAYTYEYCGREGQLYSLKRHINRSIIDKITYADETTPEAADETPEAAERTAEDAVSKTEEAPSTAVSAL